VARRFASDLKCNTPTIASLINERLDQHPDEQSMLQLVLLFRINGSRDGDA